MDVTPPHTPTLEEEEEEEEDETYFQYFPQVAAQDPQSKKGSQDLSKNAEQEQSSTVPQFENYSNTQVQWLDLPQFEEGIEQASHDAIVQQGQSPIPTHATEVPLRWYVEEIWDIVDMDSLILQIETPKKTVYEDH